MEELLIEEKAKRYDSMFERLKEMYNNNKTNVAARLICERYFPELKECEDERIRKKIIQLVNDAMATNAPYKKEMLAWLEKQGEHDNFRNKIQIGDKVTRNEDGVLVNLSQLNRIAKKDEKQGKQKPTDKVEPNFCKGDWVVYCNDDVDLITGIEENGYCINNGGYIPFVCENEMRLWNITDAKVGDVLVSESTCGLGTWYCIFKSLDGDESMTVYCYLTRDGRFETKKELCFDKDPYNTKPATKEQRDLLFQKIKENGYEWDAEKKKLKKIEEEVNDEDYGIDGLYHAQRILEKTLGEVDGYQSDDGILEHKCAISAVKELSKQKPAWSERYIADVFEKVGLAKIAREQSNDTLTNALQDAMIELSKFIPQPKQEWSEEDEYCRHQLIVFCENCMVQDAGAKRCAHWLKSLRPQNTWKPCDEQMDALNYVVNLMASSERPTENDLYYNILKSLRQQLKKLREK